MPQDDPFAKWAVPAHAPAPDDPFAKWANTSVSAPPPAPPPPQASSGWPATIGDLARGFVKGAAHTAIDLGELAGHLRSPFNPGAGTLSDAVDTLYGTPGLSKTATAAARDETAYRPDNIPERIGGGLETLAEMAIPITEGVSALPSEARAIANFKSAMSAAKAVPIDLSAPGDVALRIADLAQRGGGTNWGPPPVRQFIQWATDPKKPAMTYEVARDFASNISRLSAKDLASIPPTMMREIGNLRVTLNKSVADAAGVAGKGIEHAQAMTEYAKAKRIQGVLEDIAAGAQRAVPYIGAGAAFGGSNWVTKHLVHLLGGD